MVQLVVEPTTIKRNVADYRKRFLFYCTLQLAQKMTRRRTEHTSKSGYFWFFLNCCSTHLSNFFDISICCKWRQTIEGLTLSSSTSAQTVNLYQQLHRRRLPWDSSSNSRAASWICWRFLCFKFRWCFEQFKLYHAKGNYMPNYWQQKEWQ